MKHPALLAVALVAMSAFALPALAADDVAKAMDTPAGKVLADAKGMTLYTFDQDMGGKSACNGPCAQNWPPLMAGADAKGHGDWSVVTRDDGSKQWAVKGKPLYTFAKDAKSGETNGDGFKGIWHVAKP
ncbi:conserved exported hypothetical protein [Candidatus Terasakiella magnetica]|nr:conserved exported hypothetical protein [Candidatus Terasakiella magnetica]